MEGECEGALSFVEAWDYVLRTPEVREWAFNRNLPAADELLHARRHGPLLRTFHVDGTRQHTGGFTPDFYRMRHDEVFCCVRALADGTRLGYVLNAKRQDICVPVFGQHDARYCDPSQLVQRLVVAAPPPLYRLFVLELNWLASGALSVRYQPCSRLGTVLRLAIAVRLFSKDDAARLTAAGGHFFNAQLSDDRYRLDCLDSAFQSACAFCVGRGLRLCACPMPMRRRSVGDSGGLKPYVAQHVDGLWEELGRVLTAAEFAGAALHNMKLMRAGTDETVVIDGNITPFRMDVRGINAHEAMQSYLQLTLGGLSALLVSDVSSNSLSSPQSANVDSSSWGKTSSTVEVCARVPLALEGSAMKSPAVDKVALGVSVTTEASGKQDKKAKRFVCPICGLVIRYKKSNLDRHIANKHRNERRFQCTEPNCERKFQTNSNLQRHRKIVHNLTPQTDSSSVG